MTYIDQLPIDEQAKELDRLFRNVFSTQEGRIVFTEILKNLFFFDVPENQENQVLRNYATLLFNRVMVSDPDRLVSAMLEVKE